MNEMLVKWNHIYTNGITLSPSTKINTLLFADDQVLVVNSGDNFQSIANNFGMEISLEKSELMTFLGHDPERCKIVVDNKCLQQVKNFKCFGCEIS